MSEKTFHFRARWIVPVSSPPIENGVISFHDGLIRSVQPAIGFREASVDLGDVILMPGLINAHTHLEFSDLATPLGAPGIEFTEWIRRVIQNRIDRSAQSSSSTCKAGIIAQGMTESMAAGVVALGEIASLPTAIGDYEFPGLDVTVFLELLGRDPKSVEERMSDASEFLDSQSGSSRLALSPHAPYSVHPELLNGMIGLAEQERCPVAMHLAETIAERRLVSEQTGPFVGLFEQLGVWHPESYQPGEQILDYISRLRSCAQTLVIHGNYLTDDEIQLVATTDNMNVVYCPRTHTFFGHDDYPLEQMIEQNVQLALGTDSRASNPDLNLFSEMKHVSMRHPNVDWQTIVEMGTINGANALGISDRFGSLEPGKVAQVCVIEDLSKNELTRESLFGPASTSRPLVTDKPS